MIKSYILSKHHLLSDVIPIIVFLLFELVLSCSHEKPNPFQGEWKRLGSNDTMSDSLLLRARSIKFNENMSGSQTQEFQGKKIVDTFAYAFTLEVLILMHSIQAKAHYTKWEQYGYSFSENGDTLNFVISEKSFLQFIRVKK